jgi:hypothetical protein
MGNRAPKARVPFHRLATVELKLVMHFLDRSSLLRLSRCNRFALSAAGSDFAWKCIPPESLHLPPFHIDFSSEEVARLTLNRIHASLLRYATYAVDAWPEGDHDKLRCLGDKIRVSRLNFRDQCSHAVFLRVLHFPCFDSLTALRTPQLSEDVLTTLIQIKPKLRSFYTEFSPSYHPWAAGIPSGQMQIHPNMKLFAQFESLTDLRLNVSDSAVGVDLSACTRLKSLALAKLHPKNYPYVLTALSLVSLHELTLSEALLDRDDFDQWVTGFRSMVELRTLKLICCTSVPSFLEAITEGRPRSLSLLQLGPDLDLHIQEELEFLQPHIRQFLTSLPHVKLEFTCGDLTEWNCYSLSTSLYKLIQMRWKQWCTQLRVMTKRLNKLQQRICIIESM